MSSAPSPVSKWRRTAVVAVALVIGVIGADLVVAGRLTQASASNVAAVSFEGGRSDAASSADASVPGRASLTERSASDQEVRGLGDRGRGRSHRYDDRTNLARADARLGGYRSGPNTARAVHASELVESPLWTATKNKASAQNAYRHFADHGAEFPDIQNSVEYAGKAQNFLRTPPGEPSLALVRTVTSSGGIRAATP